MVNREAPPVDEFPAPVRRVAEAAAALGLSISVRLMPDSTRTAAEAAIAVGRPVGAIVKSLVFRGRSSGEPVLLLVSGQNRVDQDEVAAEIGEALDRADAAFVRSVTGYAIGGVPPFGHATAIRPWIDRDLLPHATVWAAAGTPHALFEIDPLRLSEATGARVIAVTPPVAAPPGAA